MEQQTQQSQCEAVGLTIYMVYRIYSNLVLEVGGVNDTETECMTMK